MSHTVTIPQRLQITGCIGDRKPDIVCSFCPFVSSFYFCHLQSGDKGLEWTKNFATLPPSPTRSSPSIEPHASLQTASHISEAHTATHSCLSKQDITLLLYWGMTGAAGWALDCPGGREVWVHRTLTPLKLLHRQETGITRVNHWSLFLVFLGGEGKKKKKKKHFSFLGFRALTCWGGPQVL